MNLKLGLPPRCEMLFTEPVTKLSRPITLWPRDKSRSVKCEPRKPAAPVMTEVGFWSGVLSFFKRDMDKEVAATAWKSRVRIGGCQLFRAGAAQHGRQGAQQNFQVKP